VLIVMESAGGVRAAAALRNAINAQTEVRVVSQADIARQKLAPAAMLTVSAVASQIVSVAYWDMTGERDWLSSPAPARADQMDAVVLALASALIERHQPDLLERAQAGTSRALGEMQLVRTPDALYAVLGRFGRLYPRSNVSLRFEDF
jgi:glutamine synthetase type III